MIFVSKGYFKSINCLREADCTVAKDKHIALMHDPVKGGAPLEVIKEHECPEHLLGPIFMCPDGVTARPVITWHRIKDFQLVSLKLLTEQMLLGCATYANLLELPLYLPGEISARKLMFSKKVRCTCRCNPCDGDYSSMSMSMYLGDHITHYVFAHLLDAGGRLRQPSQPGRQEGGADAQAEPAQARHHAAGSYLWQEAGRQGPLQRYS